MSSIIRKTSPKKKFRKPLLRSWGPEENITVTFKDQTKVSIPSKFVNEKGKLVPEIALAIRESNIEALLSMGCHLINTKEEIAYAL